MAERITVHGLCVRETEVGEADKIITLVTMEYGRLSVSGKGIKSLKSRHMAATQPYCYSLFTLRKSKKYFYIEESELIECFWELRSDIEKLSLAAYICDVCADVSVEGQADPELLRLTLNTLFAVNKGMQANKVKAAFELRCASVIGFCPDLSRCGMCSCGLSGDAYIDIMNGRLLCRECKPRAEREEELEGAVSRLYMLLSPGTVAAMRYIVESAPERFLSFNLGEDDMYLLSQVCESYLTNHLEHGFSTLSFYKSILM